MKVSPREPLFLILMTFLSTAEQSYDQPCASPQYIEFGKSGIIDCSFDENVFLLVWYNSTDFSNEEPLLYFKRPVKSGDGYSTGEFDINSDGSLLINRVALNHDHYFTVVMTNSASDNIIPYTVRAVVTVKPQVTFPVIHECGNETRICFFQVEDHENITCSIRRVRPEIHLKWIMRTANGDKNLSYDVSVSTEGMGFTTTASIRTLSPKFPKVALVVCKSDSLLHGLSNTESIALVQSNHTEDIYPGAVQKFIEVESQFKLACNGKKASFWVWKRRKSINSYTETTIAAFVAIYSTPINLSQEYSLDDEGSLMTSTTNIHHEGVYICSYGNDVEYGSDVYNVIVYVPPAPAHPVVDGCEHQEPCILEKNYEDYLTCRLLGIRPAVELEWNVFPAHLSSKITFSDQFHKISPKGNSFDVLITSKYHVNDALQERLTIECKVSSKNKVPFHLAKNFEIFFLRGNHVNVLTEEAVYDTTQSENNRYVWIVIACITVITIGLLTGMKVVKARRKRRLNNQTTFNEKEDIPVLTISGMSKHQSEKKNLFIAQLKGTYEEMCASVQPVPFIREKMFGVNEVFVDSDLECFHPSENKSEKGSWKRICSYRDIFIDRQLISKRYILEGGPGYGKSMFSLQLAYDWCNEAKYPILENVDVLILLRLRQMGERVPIAKAIKHLLLPEDTPLSDEDLMTILLSCRSILFVLDGYDEYPDFETDDITDVKKILKRDTFQQSYVILTTRSNCLPKEYSPQTKRIRLKGFDEQSRETYISKAVAGNNINVCKLLKACLRENPVLSDLCQVPMFFAMFAHITYERKEIESFTSVTSFFRYIISCIHSHMQNKPKKATMQHPSSKENKIDHSQLNKEAFDSLNGQNRRDKWIKDDMCEHVGQNCYEHFVSSGILISEKVMKISDKPGVSEYEHIQYLEEVRFCHKLFCEWYAAHYLSKIAAEYSLVDFSKALKGYNPLELQYLLRFACGLNPRAAGNIINYLKQTNVPDEIAILCIIEQTGDVNGIIDSIKDLCSRAIEIRRNFSKMMLRSTIQLLEMASMNSVEIFCLRFWDCFVSDREDMSSPHTDSGLLQPRLKGITCIEIYESDKMLQEEDAADILEYVSTCMELKTVKFFDCLMPFSLNGMDKIKFGVMWYTRLGEWYKLDVSSGYWEIYNGSYSEEAVFKMTKAKYDQLL